MTVPCRYGGFELGGSIVHLSGANAGQPVVSRDALSLTASCATGRLALKKFDDELQTAWAEVYAPGFPDSQGDFMSRAEIRDMAWNFAKAGRLNKIDVGHDQIDSGCYVVETFIARDDDPDFISGSWVLGVKIPVPDIWTRVKSGEINGFSIDALAYQHPRTIEIDVPDELCGKTTEHGNHQHDFIVKFAADGRFLGGSTGFTDGHSHEIIKGTVTEAAAGHTHRFSFLEGIGLCRES